MKFSFFTPHKGLMAGWTVEEVGGWASPQAAYTRAPEAQERSKRGADGLETAQNARRTLNGAIKRTPGGR